jgi:hypothetical protein
MWAIERQLSLASDYEEADLVAVLLAMNPDIDESIGIDIERLLDLGEQVADAEQRCATYGDEWIAPRDIVIDEYVEHLRGLAKLVRGVPSAFSRPRHTLGASPVTVTAASTTAASPRSGIADPGHRRTCSPSVLQAHARPTPMRLADLPRRRRRSSRSASRTRHTSVRRSRSPTTSRTRSSSPERGTSSSTSSRGVGRAGHEQPPQLAACALPEQPRGGRRQRRPQRPAPATPDQARDPPARDRPAEAVAAVVTTANDLTDRQWVAAYVTDNAPWLFDPIAEAPPLPRRAGGGDRPQ